jgi:hypothetical protein
MKSFQFITKKDLVHRGIPEENAESLMLYKGSYYESMNHYLRTKMFVGDEKISTLGELKQHITQVEDAMTPLKSDKIVYRGIPMNVNDIASPVYEYVDTGFMSTTTNVNKTYKFTYGSECCIFQIRLPKGVRVFDFQDTESEVLVEPGMKLVHFIYDGIRSTPEGQRMFFTCDAVKMTPSEMERHRENAHRIQQDREHMKKTIVDYKAKHIQDLLDEIDWDAELEN